MADLPKQANCPIKAEDGVCMCAVKRCDYIDLDDCFRMRSAYFYGFVTAETEANKVLNRIHEGIEALFPKEGEKDG